MGKESTIEKRATSYARQKGCWVRKFKSPGNRAAPDKIFMTAQGVVFFIEFKRPGENPTAAQYRELNEIKNRGGNGHWADNLDVAKRIIDSHTS